MTITYDSKAEADYAVLYQIISDIYPQNFLAQPSKTEPKWPQKNA